MGDNLTNANQMALERGINPKGFRDRLRRNLKAGHTSGSWRTEFGSDKHQKMKHELEAMIAETGKA